MSSKYEIGSAPLITIKNIDILIRLFGSFYNQMEAHKNKINRHIKEVFEEKFDIEIIKNITTSIADFKAFDCNTAIREPTEDDFNKFEKFYSRKHNEHDINLVWSIEAFEICKGFLVDEKIELALSVFLQSECSLNTAIEFYFNKRNVKYFAIKNMNKTRIDNSSKLLENLKNHYNNSPNLLKIKSASQVAVELMKTDIYKHLTTKRPKQGTIAKHVREWRRMR